MNRNFLRTPTLLLVISLMFTACIQPTQAPGANAPAAQVAPLLGNLGEHHHPITTSSELAQRYFDEGLILAYGFNHAEAIRSFRDATTLDPNCAMCYWGIAFALGPNINAPMANTAAPEAFAAVQQALALAPQVSAGEQAYIEALAKRYSAEPVADRKPLDLAFAEAMRTVVKSYPDDLDAAVLLAEALMDLTPWNYWTADGQPTAYTEDIVATLEAVLARNSDHPAANHYYIHAVEASQTPERAVPSAERLARLVPGAGHLVHMPAHVYWRVGRYHDAVQANEHAIHSDETYIPDRDAQGLYPMLYYPHNIHFLFTAAHMEGNSALAIEAARKLVSKVPDAMVAAAPALENFRPMLLFALVRFGKWEEILNEPQPLAEHQFTTGMWHWARGLAFVRQGQLDQATAEYAPLSELAQSDAMEALKLRSVTTAATLLQIAAHILAGELAGARGETDVMISQLEAAIALQDQLAYREPPLWYYPVRQTLGALLLEAGRAVEAEAVYRNDLKQYPHNGWSLFGLMKSLEAQGKTAEAVAVQKEFAAAWQYADVTLTASRIS